MKKGFSTYGISLALFVVFLLIWEGVTTFFAIEEWLLPSPTAIISTGIAVIPALIPDIQSTFLLSIVGLFIGSVTGIAVAGLLHYWPTLEKIALPYVVISQNIPIIVLAPLLVIWFGFGALPKIIVITLVCFFPITVSLLGGLKETPDSYKKFIRISGGSRRQLFWKVEVPYAVPSFFSGIRIAATYSVMGAVISEWLGAQKGIGVFMTLATSNFRTDRVFVAIAIVVVMSLLYVAILKGLEQWWMNHSGRRKKDASNN